MIRQRLDGCSIAKSLQLVATLCTSRLVAVHAGHILLFWSDELGRAVPSLRVEADGMQSLPGALQDAVILTEGSWRYGHALAAAALEAGASRVRVVILVNDWQYLPPDLARADARQRFYEQFAERSVASLFAFDWQSDIDARLLHHDRGSPALRRSPFISEKTLRNRFAKRTHRALTHDRCDIRIESLSESTVSPPGCAEEVVELLRLLDRKKVEVLVNVFPRSCVPFVLAGTEEFLATSEESGLSNIVNIAVEVDHSLQGLGTESNILTMHSRE